jgi:hypothetical protein
MGDAVMLLTRWGARKLRPADLAALSAVYSGTANLQDASVQRLKRRHYISAKPDGRLILTFRGQMALMVRRSKRH